MTVIAVRDGVMASDSMVSSGDVRWCRTKKIKRLSNGALLGIAGDVMQASSYAIMLNRAIKAGHQPIIEMLEPYDDIACLYLCKEGVYAMESGKGKAGIFTLEGDFFAEGSGLESALAAMYMGADAELAVMVACDVNHSCMLPVQVERL